MYGSSQLTNDTPSLHILKGGPHNDQPITTATTGPPEYALHWQTERSAAPRARHCSAYSDLRVVLTIPRREKRHVVPRLSDDSPVLIIFFWRL